MQRCSTANPRQLRCGNYEIQNLEPLKFSFDTKLGMNMSISQVVKMEKRFFLGADGDSPRRRKVVFTMD
jgi:hypothetical protein